MPPRIYPHCTAPGCANPHYATGLCRPHYIQRRNAAQRAASKPIAPLHTVPPAPHVPSAPAPDTYYGRSQYLDDAAAIKALAPAVPPAPMLPIVTVPIVPAPPVVKSK